MQDDFAIFRTFINQFIQVTDEEWRLHRNFLSKKSIKKGEHILQAGQVCDHVSFVTKGLFRVYNQIREEEVTNYFSFENSYATDYESFLTRKPTFENIQAMEDSEVLNLNFDNMQILYEEIPAWQKFGRLMAENVFIIAVDRVRSLLLYTPEELYLKTLNECPQLFERVPQHYIASYLGIKPESLSRIRRRVMELKRN